MTGFLRGPSMINKLAYFFSIDTNFNATDEERRRKLLTPILAFLVLLTLLSLPASFFFILQGSSDPGYKLAILASVISLAGFVGIYFVNRRSSTTAGILLITIIVIVLVFSDTPREVLEGRSTLYLTIPIIMASLLVRSWVSFLTYVFTEIWLIWLAISNDILFNSIGSLGLFMIALLSWVGARSLEERNTELEEAFHDLQRNQEMLILEEKMASLGRLTAGIAHEINTPVAAIRNALKEIEMLTEEYRSSINEPEVTGEDHNQIAQEMMQLAQLGSRAAERTAEFIRNIKSQPRLLEMKDRHFFDAVSAIEQALLLLNHAARKSNCEISFEPQAAEIILYGLPGRLSQVVTNLVANAIDACALKGGGPIRLRLSAHHHRVELSVSDKGSGISPQDLTRIFDPMFTTKPFGEGTGLGLSIVKDIIKGEFGGTIEVDSQLDLGTTFLVKIPLSKGEQD